MNDKLTPSPKSKAVQNLERKAVRGSLERLGYRFLGMGFGPLIVTSSVIGMILSYSLVSAISSLIGPSYPQVQQSLASFAGLFILGMMVLPAFLVLRLKRRFDRVAGERQVAQLMTKVQLEELEERLEGSPEAAGAEQGLTIVDGEGGAGSGELSLHSSEPGAVSLENTGRTDLTAEESTVDDCVEVEVSSD